jgi:hypothetical protein
VQAKGGAPMKHGAVEKRVAAKWVSRSQSLEKKICGGPPS